MKCNKSVKQLASQPVAINDELVQSRKAKIFKTIRRGDDRRHKRMVH